jgi:endo-1,4-beta-D-glucanase Y
LTAFSHPEQGARPKRGGPRVIDVEVTWQTLAAVIALVTFIAASALIALVTGIATSRHDVLRETWETYRGDFITADGRVRENPPFDWGETTSEGQAYAMLRAAWLDDRPTFDRTWHWTQVHLQVRGDALFGWLWGRDQAGRWALLNRSTAADADEDIALALVFAAHRWPDGPYLAEARSVISGVWAREVVVERGRPYLVAGEWAADMRPQIVVNPSYLAPYAYRVFAAEDPAHPWAQLVDSSYRVLDRCTWSRLNEDASAGLPPNWCVLSADSGTARAYWEQGGDTYGSDAFRVMWRVALDFEWNGAPQAISYLKRSQFLRREWSHHHRLLAQYQHNGSGDQKGGEEPFAYAGDIGDFMVIDPAAARSILRDKLLVSLHRERSAVYWGDRANYYAENWIWFGVALSEHRLVDLAEPWGPTCQRESAESRPCLVRVSLRQGSRVA